MHNASIDALHMDAIYLAFDMPPANLIDGLRTMGLLGFRGVNLTVPLKEVAFRGVDELAESARLTGSVNTIEFLPNKQLRGHSTDGEGFLRAVQETFDCTPAGQSIFMLGCGGAGRAVAITVACQHAKEIVLADLDIDRMLALQSELEQHAPDVKVKLANTSPAEWAKEAIHADLIVQASPVGMKADDPSPLPKEAFRSGQRVFDMIYMYPQTAIMKVAEPMGADVSNGLGMLLHQGAKSFEIWTGMKPNTAAMRKALEQAVYQNT
jgi:shikimate dehydrogenase